MFKGWSYWSCAEFYPSTTNCWRRLDYNFYIDYIDTAYTQIWRDSTGRNSLRALGSVNNAPTSFEIFSFIPTHQFVPASSYSDAIVVTLKY
ncbi:spore coat protein U domain-containing protein [Thermosynechococcus sp. Uc]|uniref:spore coat protein U domain-containing protein n=1 Tax=Thermosynechococcus sp. Uc TaxID=3034853 RepID=UPI00345C2B99